MPVVAGADALFLFFCGCFALVLALGQIVAKRGDAPWNMFLLLVLGAANQLVHAFTPISGTPPVAPVARLIVVFSILLIGPMFFRYVDGILETREERPAISYAMIALLAGGFAGIVGLEYFFLPAAPGVRPWRYSGILAVAIFLFFIVLLIYRFRDLFYQSPGDPLARAARSLVVLTGCIALAAIIGATMSPLLRRAAQMGVGCCVVLLYLASRRYPRLLDEIRERIARRRYVKSGLHRLDVDGIVARMKRLMEEERLFALEGLTLPQLAEMLEIRSHELSEILNSVLRRGFHGFVNEYRVQAACELLLDEPERSTLSIGIAVGFNSNSAFYKAFKQFQGMSPARFRDRHSKAGA